ncbi:hypothetical protein ABTZ58_23980 [Streptomyces sp. NPDC094143]|uniref:RICIN domain-containing protein n=1 Tax=Streptomyces sp. NPDC094143 TaxID=3155310 RepID=UPI00331714B1
MPPGQDSGSSELPRTEAAGDTGNRPEGVRRAVPLTASAGDPGDAWNTALRSRARARAVAADGSAEPEPAAAVVPAQGAVRGAALTGVTAAGRTADEATAPGTTAEPLVSIATATAAAPVPDTTEAEAEAEAGTDVERAGSARTASGGGDGPAPGEGDVASPGRPKKPMLAAAGLVGAVLLAVPFLLAAGGEEGDSRATARDGASHDLLLTDGGPNAQEAGAFVAEKPVDKQPVKSSDGTSGGKEPKGGSKQEAGSGVGPDTDDAVVTTTGGGDGGDEDSGSGSDERTDQDTDSDQDSDGAAEPKTSALQDAKVTRPESPARYWETTSHKLTNQATGKCLTKDSASRTVRTGSCGDTWARYVVGDGTYLLKHKAANRCLDTNGQNLYVSSCTTKDTGQLWRPTVTEGCVVSLSSVPFGKYLTGWNDGSASLAASTTIDKADKRRWRIPSLGGC